MHVSFYYSISGAGKDPPSLPCHGQGNLARPGSPDDVTSQSGGKEKGKPTEGSENAGNGTDTNKGGNKPGEQAGGGQHKPQANGPTGML